MENLSRNSLDTLQKEYFESLLDLSRRRFDDEKQFISFTLEELLRLTRSQAGYFHFLKSDQVNLELFAWSKEVMKTCTSTINHHYPLSEAGIWADSIRQGKTVIQNDYPNQMNRKGLPDGHVPLLRHMSVPIWDQGKMVLVAGVGNKTEPYDEVDARFMEMFLDNAWKTIVKNRSEVRLTRSQKDFREVVEAHPDAVCILDPQSKVLFMNYHAETLLGRARSGMLDSPLDLALPSGNEILESKIIPAGESAPKSVEIRQADILWAEQPARLVIIRNVSGKKEFEDRLRRTEKIEAIGHLAGGIAHDFNNILGVIMGNADLLQTGLTENSPYAALVTQILDASHRGADLTRKLLAYGQKQILTKVTLDLNDRIREMLKMVKRLFPENIEVSFVSGHTLGSIYADPTQVDQVLMNLCLNARDAMPKGGRLTLETQNVLVTPEYVSTHPWAELGRYVLFSVSDNGCGIPKTISHRIFDPFFTTKPPEKNSGMGLATVQGIVAQHQGMVQVYSEPEKGTIVKVYFPTHEAKAVELPAIHEKQVKPGRELVLLAEDDDGLRTLGKAFLELGGYQVLAVNDGEEAIRVIENRGNEIRLAILDVIMPHRGGKDVFDFLKGSFPDIRVLFTSGYTANAIHTDFVLKDQLQLLMKPFRREVFLRKVREVLDSE
jgi:signal transduction histidine kinase